MDRSGVIAFAVTFVTLGCEIGGGVAAQTLPTPIVSPDPVPDVPPTPSNVSPFPFFNDYSWRSFIALNWPAMTGAANRGQPDRSKVFGDANGPRVWATWKSRYEIFQPGGALPSDWTSYDGKNPCGVGFANDAVTLSSFTAFGDFNQAVTDLDRLGNPLVAQNRTYARYEVRVNQPEFNSIVDHKWYIRANLPSEATSVPFNNGSTEIKAAWRILTEKDTAAIRSRYYVVPNAQVFDVASKKCMARDIALIGLHIVTKTPDRPQWIWSTFEHVDNVPARKTEPKPPFGMPFSFNAPSQPQNDLKPLRMPPP